MFSNTSAPSSINHENSAVVARKAAVNVAPRKPLADRSVNFRQEQQLKTATPKFSIKNDTTNDKDDMIADTFSFKEIPDTYNDFWPKPLSDTDLINIRNCFIGYRPETPPPEELDVSYDLAPVISLPKNPFMKFTSLKFEEIDVPSLDFDY